MRRASVGHIRPMLIGVLTGILLMLAQPVHATCQTQRAVTSLSRLSSVPVVMTEDLGIDTQDVERQVTAIDESTGAAELRTLARVSSYEEAWAYLPDAHLWVQTGTRQLIDPQTGPQVEVDRAFLLLLIATFRSVHLYHIHPANYFAIKSGDDASWSERRIADLDKEEVNSLGLALPSPEDVATAIDVALQQQSLDSTSSVKNFVVSPFGTIEFEPTPVGRKLMFYEHNNPLGSIERALIVTDAIVRAPHSVERMAAMSPMLTTSEIIAELCAQMTDDNFLMTIDHVQSCHQTFCLSRGAQAR